MWRPLLFGPAKLQFVMMSLAVLILPTRVNRRRASNSLFLCTDDAAGFNLCCSALRFAGCQQVGIIIWGWLSYIGSHGFPNYPEDPLQRLSTSLYCKFCFVFCSCSSSLARSTWLKRDFILFRLRHTIYLIHSPITHYYLYHFKM